MIIAIAGRRVLAVSVLVPPSVWFATDNRLSVRVVTTELE